MPHNSVSHTPVLHDSQSGSQCQVHKQVTPVGWALIVQGLSFKIVLGLFTCEQWICILNEMHRHIKQNAKAHQAMRESVQSKEWSRIEPNLEDSQEKRGSM
eukprot:177475-Pelagomonas_calceolata.AAC.4